MRSTLRSRFEAKVCPEPNTGCFLWTGYCDPFGYGRMHLENPGKAVLAHRVSYEFTFGKIHDDLCVLHRCDVPSCVNPAHLFLGTRTDNANDKVKKNRLPFGFSLSHTKLSDDQVRAIRIDSRPQDDIAKDYGIASSMVSRIKSRVRRPFVKDVK